MEKTRKSVVVMGREATLLSSHFTVAEFVKSDTARDNDIDNSMDLSSYEEAKKLSWNVLEKIRSYYKRPVIVLSGYRCEELNRLVKGSSTSQHMCGQAADIRVEGISNTELFDYVKNKLDCDQVILEPTWVHVSYKGKANRRQYLIKKGGRYVKA